MSGSYVSPKLIVLVVRLILSYIGVLFTHTCVSLFLRCAKPKNWSSQT